MRHMKVVSLSVGGALGITLLIAPPESRACDGANVALTKAATASAAESWSPPSLAFDGDTLNAGWNAGTYAPQWLEVDLGLEIPVACIRFLVDMRPDGYVVHVVEGRTESGTPVALGTYAGPAALLHWLTVTPEHTTPVRYVRVTTTQSPSWVAWYEVQVMASMPTPTQVNTWGALKILYR